MDISLYPLICSVWKTWMVQCGNQLRNEATHTNLAIADIVEAPQDMDVEDQIGCDYEGLTFFRVVLTRPSKKKTVHTAVGAGGRLNHEAALVAIHDVIAANEEGTEVLLRGSSRCSTNTTSHVIGEMIGSVEDIKTSVLSWQKLHNGWTFKDLPFGDGDGEFDCNQIVALLAGLTDAGAFPKNVESLGYTAHPDQVALPTALEAEAYGFVRRSA